MKDTKILKEKNIKETKKVLNDAGYHGELSKEKLFRNFIDYYTEGVARYDIYKLIGFAYRKSIEAGEKGRRAKVSLSLLSSLELIVSSSNYSYPVQVENDLFKLIMGNFTPQWGRENNVWY